MANGSSARARGRRTGRQALILLAALGLAAAVAGCRKADEAPAGPVGPEPMSEEEQRRGMAACQAYAERVCRCAKNDPSLEEDCSFAPARPSSLEGALGVVNEGHGKMAINDQIASQTAARDIIKGCFEADARLDPATCPRTPPEPGSGAATDVTPGASDGPPAVGNEPAMGHE